MDVFHLRQKLIADYRAYSISFVRIRDRDIREYVASAVAAFLGNAELECVERAWPEAERVLGLIADTADDEVRTTAREAIVGEE